MKTILVDVDPNKLVVDSNVRSKLGDLGPLVESIREHGVLQALLVTKEGDKYHVKAGSRRTAAAIQAKTPTVPCVVLPEGTDASILSKQLVENLHRRDLTAAEEAKGYEQLEAFGMVAADIARIAGRDVAHIEASLTIAKSKTASTVAAKHDLTLDQAAAIVEFETDKAAVKELTDVATKRPAEFPHVVVTLRAERDRLAKVAELRARLGKDSTPITETRPTWDFERPPTRLSELRDASGKDMTVELHKGCAGHAAYLVDVAHQDPKIEYVCLRPKSFGHKPRTGGGNGTTDQTNLSPEEREAALEERRAMLAGNKEWRLAEPIRVEFIQSLLARRTCPKGVLRFVTEEIMGDPAGIGGKMGPTNEKLLAAFLGVAQGDESELRYGRAVGIQATKKEKTDARLPLILLAQIAATREQMMDQTTWRSGSSSSARWLKFLAAQGYGLSKIEKKAAARK